MAYIAGETIDTSILLVGGETGQVAGDFTTLTAYLLPTASPSVTVTLAEIGGGRYSLSFIPTEAGQWEVVAVFDGTPYDESFDVDEAPDAALTLDTGSITISSGIRRDELRRRVGRRLRDYLGLVATDGGSVSTVVDDVNLAGESGAFMHAQLLCAGGTAGNVGEVRRVLSNAQTSGTISLNRDLPAATQVDDTFDLFRLSGVGFLLQDYDGAIASAISNSGREFYVPLGPTTLDDAFDADAPDLTLPDEYAVVYRIEYQDQSDDWNAIPVARRPGFYAEGWFAQGLSGVVRVEGIWRDEASGRPIRVFGYGPQPDVEEDSDLIALDPEWMELTCAAFLAQRRTTDREWLATAAGWIQLANGRRLAMHPAFEPDSRQVR